MIKIKDLNNGEYQTRMQRNQASKIKLGNGMYTFGKYALIASNPILLGAYATYKLGPKLLKLGTSEKALSAYRSCGSRVLQVSKATTKGLSRFAGATISLGSRLFNKTNDAQSTYTQDYALGDKIESKQLPEYSVDSGGKTILAGDHPNRFVLEYMYGDDYIFDDNLSYKDSPDYTPEDSYVEPITQQIDTEEIDFETKYPGLFQEQQEHTSIEDVAVDNVPSIRGLTYKGKVSSPIQFPLTPIKDIKGLDFNGNVKEVTAVPTQPFLIQDAVVNQPVVNAMEEASTYDWEAEYNNVYAEIQRAEAEHTPVVEYYQFDSNSKSLDSFNIGSDMVAKFFRNQQGEITRTYTINGESCAEQVVSMEDYISFKTQADQISKDRLELEEYNLNNNLETDSLEKSEPEPELEFGNKDSLF